MFSTFLKKFSFLFSKNSRNHTRYLLRPSAVGCFLLLFASFGFGQTSETEKAILMRGQTYMLNGELDKAIQQFDLAIFYNPKSVEGYYLRGGAKLTKQDINGSINDFSKVIDLAPNLLGIEKVYNNRGTLYTFLLNQEQAFSDFNKAISANPNYALPYNGRGNIFAAKGEWDKAFSDFDKAIQLNPYLTPAYTGRGDIWFQKGDIEKALADFDKSVEFDPDGAGARIRRGTLNGLKGNWDRCADDLKKGIELNSKSSSIYAGNIHVAISDLDKFIEKNAKNANAFAVRGLIKLLSGSKIEAENDFGKSFGIDPRIRPLIQPVVKEIKANQE